MKIYFKKLADHDRTHEINIKGDTYRDFFGEKRELEITGHKSCVTKNIVFNFGQLDRSGGVPREYRFNSELKNLIKIEKGGDITENDIIMIKLQSNKYILEVIDSNDARYNIYNELFIGSEKHIDMIVDNEQFEDLEFSKFFRNRIIFGAPGTGKSYLLEKESKVFKNQLSKNNTISRLTDLIKDMRTYSVESIGIGFNFADEIKESKISSIIDIFGCSNDQAYRISQGKRAKGLIQDRARNKFDDYNSNENGSDQFLDNQIKKIDEKDIEISSFVFGYKYAELLFDLTSSDKIKERFSVTTTKARWINYGKKVKTLNYNLDNSEVKDFIERVTFYPNYSYSQFVGCYKPVMKENEESGEEEITYKFVPGPFVRVYERAKRNPKKDFLLIIEEINRANAPAVFGDIFQLLDRDASGKSQYSIVASEDLRNYLKERDVKPYGTIEIPSNMYIWATMNSADQGVQPLDTAFKRRWEFEYLDIDGKIVDSKTGNKDLDELNKSIIPFDEKNNTTWGEFREKLNEHLLENCNVHEDKCLGPFFVGKEIIEKACEDKEKFHKTFKSKILMYLFEDVVKMNPFKLFIEEAGRTYSAICSKYKEIGLGIFKFANKLDKHLKEDKKSEEIKPTTKSDPDSNQP